MREMQMIGVDAVECQLALLVERLEAEPVLSVERRLLQRLQHSQTAILVEAEMLRLERIDDGVLRELHHHEMLERLDQRLVRCVFRRFRVVDVGKEARVLQIVLRIRRIVPVVGRREKVLNQLIVDGEIVEQIADPLANRRVRVALRNRLDALLRTANRDESRHNARSRTTLLQTAQKKRTLRQTQTVETTRYICHFRYQIASIIDLFFEF